VKYVLGEASESEGYNVEKWIQQDTKNTVYFEHFKTIWDTSKNLANESTIDESRAWERFQNRVKAGKEKPKVVKMKNRRHLLQVAAVILLLVAGYTTYLFFHQPGKEIKMIAQTNQNVLTDTLPDGSVVTLNKESTLTYPSKFRDETRNVQLEGEGFFNVTPDKQHPFTINVNNVQVTVVGTSFNIKSRNGETEVVVETGTVRIAWAGNNVVLDAGEKVSISAADSTMNKNKVSDKLYNYYRTKEFVCDNTPLWKLVEVLNDAYDANIIINGEELKNLKLTSPFYNESLSQVLEVISLTFDIDVIKKGGQIILQRQTASDEI
jgi:ferric-dicitrate binding protein FerR (iron transport regulator)